MDGYVSDSETVGNISVFNELLDRLRCMHEEVCASKAMLEIQAARDDSHNGNGGVGEFKIDDPWLPINFLPPKDSPKAARPPWGKTSPRVFDVQAADRLATQQERLCQCIEHLAVKQEDIGQKITKVLTMSSTPALSTRVSRAAARRLSGTNGSQEKSQPDDSEIRTSVNSRISTNSHQSSVKRFAVPTGRDNHEHQRFKFHNLIGTRTASEQFGEAIGPQWRICLRLFLQSSAFSGASSMLILSYAALIAVETDMLAHDPSMDSFTIKVIHYVFTVIFAIELFLRCLAHGWKTWCGPDAFWNRLDAFLILGGVAEMFMELALHNAMSDAMGSAKSAGLVMRGVRILRVIRTIRLVRTFRQFHDFQKMAYALISSCRTLICALALFFFVMFFFTVWLTQSAADLEARIKVQDLKLRYGDLRSTAYTLFLSVSNGISWDLCFMPLHEMSWVSAQVFIFYVVIVLFGLLNVVTSVFVESVIRSVQHHKDLIVQDKEEEKTIIMAHIKEVFRQVDSDESGYVSIEELDFFLQDNALRKYMEALEVESDDTRLLFKLLDVDGSGVISIEEFCEGCLRLKGAAKSIDIHTLSFRISNFLERWAEFTDYVEESFVQVRSKLQQR